MVNNENQIVLPVDASLKNSDIIASIPINAKITVNNGAAGNTTDVLCSIIRKRSTRQKKKTIFLFRRNLQLPIKRKI